MVTLVYVNDDWMGVYNDGQLLYQSHTVSARQLLELLKLDHEVVYDVELLPGLSLPDDLDDVYKGYGQ